MFAIVFKDDKVPMCARLRESGPDAVVTWDSAATAQAFLASKGAEVVAGYSVVAISDDSLRDMAAALGVKEEDIELVPFPA
jgi:ABC-type Fe3+-hydroxamate transport system substrate-binding protein